MIKDSAKTILCFGDSNTWGNVPSSNTRYPRSVRWPGALQNLLGDDFEIISEGLCGRTLVALDPEKPHRTGFHYLHACLESADPIDLIVVMLGTNDFKTTYSLEAEEIAQDLEEIIALIKNSKIDLEKVPEILVVAPPAVIIPKSGKLDERMSAAPALSLKLPELYKEVVTTYGAHFLNAGDHISSSSIDGYHLDADAHLKLAEIIKEKIKEIGI